MIRRYDIGREYAHSVGAPAITEQANGAYVRHDDHTAIINEFRAEKAGLERVVAAQAEAILSKDGEIARLREALQFYADGDHFIRHDDSAWDTVSGEPQNLYEDESNTATVEDGTFARAALAQQEQMG